jgi:hypothetical protein
VPHRRHGEVECCLPPVVDSRPFSPHPLDLAVVDADCDETSFGIGETHHQVGEVYGTRPCAGAVEPLVLRPRDQQFDSVVFGE